jgi:aminopeptidase
MIEATHTPLPSKETQPSVEILVERTANELLDYSLEVQPTDVVLVKFAVAAHELTRKVVTALKEKGIQVRLQVLEPTIEKTILESVSAGDFSLPLGAEPPENSPQTNAQANGVTEDQLRFFHYGPGSDEARMLSECNKVLIIKERASINVDDYKIEKQLEKEFDAMQRTLIDVRVNERRWCLISVPTENSVRPADMSLEDYTRLYYEACARPWDEVWKAQNVLVEKLTNKKTLSFEVPPPPGMDQEWTTSLTMEIVDQRPVNSVAKRNMPGSEVFCAPNIHTLEGTLAIPNPVYFKEKMLPNLRITFDKGRVADFYCGGTESDNEYIKKVLATDEGSAIAGEVGIGTNPKVTRPVPDTLLAEKSFGFHIAIGKAYEYTSYLDMEGPVNVDNGNRSAIHVDLPRLMTPEFGGGTMKVDDEVFFQDGKFLDPALAVLNG